MAEQVIRTAQRIDATYSPKLDTMLRDALSSGQNEIIIDMEDTTYICSIGLRSLAAVQKSIRKSGEGYMILRNVKPSIMEIFEVTGFAGILTIE